MGRPSGVEVGTVDGVPGCWRQDSDREPPSTGSNPSSSTRAKTICLPGGSSPATGSAMRRRPRRAGRLQQVLPEDPVEHLEHRDAEQLGHPDALRGPVLDGRDVAVSLLGVVVVGLDDRRARLRRS